MRTVSGSGTPSVFSLSPTPYSRTGNDMIPRDQRTGDLSPQRPFPPPCTVLAILKGKQVDLTRPCRGGTPKTDF